MRNQLRRMDRITEHKLIVLRLAMVDLRIKYCITADPMHLKRLGKLNRDAIQHQ